LLAAFAERPIADFVRLPANLLLLVTARLELTRNSDLKNDVLVLVTARVAPEILEDLPATVRAAILLAVLAAREVVVFTAVFAVCTCALACCSVPVASAAVCVGGTATVLLVDGTATGSLAEIPGVTAGAAVETVEPSNELNTEEDVENDGEGVPPRRLGESLNRSSFSDLLTEENGSPESSFCDAGTAPKGWLAIAILSWSLIETAWPAETARP